MPNISSLHAQVKPREVVDRV